MSENTNKAGVFLGSSALIASAVALLKVRQASAEPLPTAGELGLDEATMNLLVAMAQTGQKIDENIYKLLLAIAETNGGEAGVLENMDDFTSFRQIPVAINTATQLPDRKIPYKYQLVVKAYHTNPGIIYVAHNAADCTNINSSYTLLANEAVELQISNASRVYISSTVLGDSVICIVEQE